MRNTRRLALALALFGPATLLAESVFIPPTKAPTVGRNLQACISLKLSEMPPDEGLEITIASDDERRLLLAQSQQSASSKTITVKTAAPYVQTPEFCLRAVADQGSATYTVKAKGFTTAKGTVNLGRSAILMFAPFNAPVLQTTPRMPQKIRLESQLLDAAGKPVEAQPVAADTKIELLSSNPKTGTLSAASATIPAGESQYSVDFVPASVGTAILSVRLPAGFSTPAESATISAKVELPGIGVAGEVIIGKDLQIGSRIILGQPAPLEGLDVTLTSEDPKRLLLSASPDKLGAQTVTVRIPGGRALGQMYLQALASEGTVRYTASAPGYRERVAPVSLAPSGFMVVYAHHGPPDEAELKSKVRIPRPFIASLSAKEPEKVAIYTVYLDPVSLRGADLTVQGLRPGVTVSLELTSSDPTVGVVEGTFKLDSNLSAVVAPFKPLRRGVTNITVNTPPGFTTPSNATSVTATVKE